MFLLFLALLDGDRFEGKFRDGVHVTDTSDLMRRLVKEELLKFSEFNLGEVFQVPANVQFALIDFNDTWIQDSMKYNFNYTQDKINTFLIMFK